MLAALNLSLSEFITLASIGGVAVIIFIAAIYFLISSAANAAKNKLLAEQNAQALKDLQQADKTLLTSVSDDDLTSNLRSGKF